jgi:peptidoglycan hydrolase-like protein with peptidoglycan-binding domain
MPLHSSLFQGDPALEACLISNSAHVTPGAVGAHVGKIQAALALVEGASIAPSELSSKTYGPATAAAVLAFKRKHTIVNPTYQTEPDNIVGKQTIEALDRAVVAKNAPKPPPIPPGPTHQESIAAAVKASRASLQAVAMILHRLLADLRAANSADGDAKILAIQVLGRVHARNMAVLTDKLRLQGVDALSDRFMQAVRRANDLIQRNLTTTSGVIDEGELGRCDPKQFTPPGVPFAGTRAGDPDPKVSVCTPFFGTNADMQRDVVTHEFFHLLGLKDKAGISSPEDALDDANTMAQIVAYLHDRFRAVDSSGMSQPAQPYPTP